MSCSANNWHSISYNVHWLVGWVIVRLIAAFNAFQLSFTNFPLGPYWSLMLMWKSMISWHSFFLWTIWWNFTMLGWSNDYKIWDFSSIFTRRSVCFRRLTKVHLVKMWWPSYSTLYSWFSRSWRSRWAELVDLVPRMVTCPSYGSIQPFFCSKIG